LNRNIICLLALFLAASVVAPQARADLASFFKKPEPAYKWEKRGETKLPGGVVYDLHMVSLTWQGMNWEHNLKLCVPDSIKHPHFCLLYNTGGNGSAADNALAMTVAKASDTTVAMLFNIPNQPLYGGLTEDALIVYTWQKYLDTGDETWPLHWPMAKAVLKAMDTIQAFARQEKLPAITDFLINGGSKRGWTTWLAGASRDRRIKAIAPMAIDTLNVLAQGPHQLAAFGGKFSAEIDDYTRAGMPTKLQTPEGRRLLQLEDPYSYRDILTMPKLILRGTNDPYWAQDALNLYWDDLKGPKWVSYVPNSTHNMSENLPHLVATLAAFADAIAGNTPWPKMKWDYKETDSGVDLTVTSDIKPQSARLFRAYAKTQDFRASKWTSEPMTAVENGFTGHLDMPADGYAATFGEVTYEIDGKTFTLSTQIKILGKK
jgi:PhoPQ-activated pathogenicity-related protein